MRLVLDPAAPLWLVALAALAILSLEALPLFVLSPGKTIGRGRRAAIFLLTVLATLLAFLPIVRPSVERARRDEASASLLVDASRSMATADASLGRSRYEAAVLAARALERAVPRARFREAAFPGNASFPRFPLENSSPLGDAIARALASSAARSGEERDPAVLVLLSDGAANAGSDPVLAARAARERGARVFTVALGDPLRAPPPRIAAVDLRAPDRVREGARATVRARVVLEGLASTPAEVELALDGKSVGKAPLEPDASRFSGEASFDVDFPEDGVRTLVASVRAGARTRTASRRVRVLRGELTVALLDRPARWEHRFLRRALEETPRLALRRLDAWSAKGGESARLADDALDAVRAADVIVLGDVPPGSLPSSAGAAILAAVDQGGKGLLVLGGPEALSGALALGLGPALPQEAKDDLAFVEQPFRAVETDAGRELLAGALGIEAGEVHGLLARAPQLESSLATGLAVREHATVLLESAGRQPLLTVGRFGLGRSALLATDETWRWAFEPASRAEAAGPRELHGALFRGLVEALAPRDAGLRLPVALGLAKERAARGEVLLASVDVAPCGSASSCREVVVALEGARGETLAESRARALSGKTTVSLALPGSVEGSEVLVRATALDEGGAPLGTDERVLALADPEEERVGEPARPDLLARIADAGGGAAFAEDDVSRGVAGRAIADALDAASPVVREAFPLAGGAALVVALVSLLGAAWALRRAAGLR